MKKLLLFFFLFAFATTQAQYQPLYDISKDSARLMADQMIASGKAKFPLLQNWESKAAHAVIFLYKTDSDSEKEIQIVYNVFDGRYYFTHMTGEFDDLFPVWKQYFQQDANAETLKDHPKVIHYKTSQPTQANFRDAYREGYEILLR